MKTSVPEMLVKNKAFLILYIMSKDLELQQIEWDLHEAPEVFVPLEFTEEIRPDLFGLETTKANEMVSGLSVTIAERKVLEDAYIDVISLEITAENLPAFKDLRTKIMKNRTKGIEVWHKTNKAFYLAGGRFVDAVKNKESAINEVMESKLFDAEKFFETQDKLRKAEINKIRLDRLVPYVADVTGLDFSEMDDYDFDDYVLGKKTRFENEAKEREAEVLRIETERLAEIERQKALQVENEKLKAEAAAKELLLQKERQENERLAKIEAEKQQVIINLEREKQAKIQAIADAKLKIERDAKLKLEVELKTIENERLAKIETERIKKEKLAKAPIKKQLSVWVESFEINRTHIDKENETAKEIIAKFEGFKKWANNQVNNL